MSPEQTLRMSPPTADYGGMQFPLRRTNLEPQVAKEAEHITNPNVIVLNTRHGATNPDEYGLPDASISPTEGVYHSYGIGNTVADIALEFPDREILVAMGTTNRKRTQQSAAGAREQIMYRIESSRGRLKNLHVAESTIYCPQLDITLLEPVWIDGPAKPKDAKKFLYTGSHDPNSKEASFMHEHGVPTLQEVGIAALGMVGQYEKIAHKMVARGDNRLFLLVPIAHEPNFWGIDERYNPNGELYDISHAETYRFNIGSNRTELITPSYTISPWKHPQVPPVRHN
jgi:hypothetical protein